MNPTVHSFLEKNIFPISLSFSSFACNYRSNEIRLVWTSVVHFNEPPKYLTLINKVYSWQMNRFDQHLIFVVSFSRRSNFIGT
jgi:hypothetical protein